MKTTILLASALWFMVFAPETDKHQPSSISNSGTVTDIDGNTYKTVVIGEQEWMAENLNVTKFRNGDEIPIATSLEEWKIAYDNKQPICASYNFDESNRSKFGLIYNVYAIEDERGIAPEGFKISTKEDWMVLLRRYKDYKDNDKEFDCASAFKSKSTWDKNGNNESGLDVMASGLLFKPGENYSLEFDGLGTSTELYAGNDEDGYSRAIEIHSSLGKWINLRTHNRITEMWGGYLRCLKK